MKIGNQSHNTASIMPSAMQALVLYASLTGNTKKVARAMAEELNAPAVDVQREPVPDLTGVGLLVVGDGVYFGRPSRAMIRALQGLPPLPGVRAAVFGTYGAWPQQRRKLERLLAAKGMEIIGQFFCPGVDALFYPLRVGRPSEGDLERARAFARELARKAGYLPSESSR